MAPNLSPFLLLMIFLRYFPIFSSSTLDQNQIEALKSLNVSTTKDPCSPLHNSTVICDSSIPFQHLISLQFINCSNDIELSQTTVKSLSTLNDLQFINCPISASGPSIIFNSIKNLHSVTISQANLKGVLPTTWSLNLTYVDLSNNQLKGKIPTTLATLKNLVHLDLSSNSLNGSIPTCFGNLHSIKNVSLATNCLHGNIPQSFASITGLIHLDLGSNQLNGTIPKFISDMKGLKYLNLERNNFHGILPFNESFIKKLDVFKVGENSRLCYNNSTLSSKLKLGIAPCDKHGLPMFQQPPEDEKCCKDTDDNSPPPPRYRGPSKVVYGTAIGLASVLVNMVLCVLLSKCKCCN